MDATHGDDLKVLYEQDETAWLERSAQLIQQRRFEELDYDNLNETSGSATGWRPWKCNGTSWVCCCEAARCAITPKPS
ncbi:MAG: DUF29 family protein [Gemmataceae bacterium]